jgi:ribosomal protein S16
VISAQKNLFIETLGWYQPSDFSSKKPIFLKHWVGINPVILAQKNLFIETLGWYQPSDFSPKKSIF